MKFEVECKLFEDLLSLVTFAVYEHVQSNGTREPFKSDPGWEDSYRLMEDLERVQREQVVR